jgi:hypothetical protein
MGRKLSDLFGLGVGASQQPIGCSQERLLSFRRAGKPAEVNLLFSKHASFWPIARLLKEASDGGR